MSLISYAQNLEDVMLLRALGTVTRGFYIDVGAYDPDVDSVTRAFYERGWRGVNIEPVEACFARMVERRPDEINLQVAVAEKAGEQPFYIIAQNEAAGADQDDISGLSTLDPAIAAHHAANGFTLKEARLLVTTLSDICHEHVRGDIHFLKVDVEGAERAVLAGADFTRYRPWIILVEATRPSSQEKSYEEWEPLLIEANYRFVWFDGLNRFYVAEEKFSELSHHFDAPPNVFDNFKRFDAGTERILSELQIRVSHLQDALTQSEERASAQASDSEQLRSEAEALKESCAKQAEELDRLQSERGRLFAQLSSLQQRSAAQSADLNQIHQELVTHRASHAAERQALIAERDARSSEAANLIIQLEHLSQRAAVLDDLIYNLRWSNGPRAVRAVLPLARVLRAVYGTHLSAEDASAFEAKPPAQTPGDARSVGSKEASGQPTRNWKKQVALPFYRLIRPVVKPLAWRIRTFLLQDFQWQLSQLNDSDAEIRAQLEEGLNRIINELRNVPRQDPVVSSAIVHTIETALLTLALDKFDRSD